jgi:hypothetical protein
VIPELSGKLVRVEDVLAAIAGDCYLPKRAAARYLGMSCRKLEGLHLIERYRIGGMLYFRRSVLDDFMRAHTEMRGQEHAPATGLRQILEAARKRALAQEKNG